MLLNQAVMTVQHETTKLFSPTLHSHDGISLDTINSYSMITPHTKCVLVKPESRLRQSKLMKAYTWKSSEGNGDSITSLAAEAAAIHTQ